MSWLFCRAFVIACSTKEATARRSPKDFYPLRREPRHCLTGAVRISRHYADGATGRGKVEDALSRAAAGKLRLGTCVHNATARGIGPDCVGRNRRLCKRAGLGLSVVFPVVFSAAGKEGLAALNGVASVTCTCALMGPPTVSSQASYAEFAHALEQSRPQRERLHRRSLASRQQRTHCSTIFYDTYEALKVMPADVLVSHEAPSEHPYGFAALDALARAMGVRTLFHGHHHDRRDYIHHWSALGFKAYGVGFCGITALDGRVVSPGDFD